MDHPFTVHHAELLADWWAARLKIPEKREAFRAALLRELGLRVGEIGRLKLKVDYDPFHELLHAVRGAGIECMGWGFSAEGILPTKTRTYFNVDGTLESIEGYWAKPVPLTIDIRDSAR